MSSDPGTPTRRSTSRVTASHVLAYGFLVAFFVVLVVFAVSASPTENDSRSATAGLPDLRQDLAAHEWLLDAGDSSIATRDANSVTLVFGEDVVTGQGPCNAYRGRVDIDDDDDTVTITDLAQTNRSCEPSTMRAEREYFSALRKVRDVDLDDAYNARTLVLDNDIGDRLAYDAIEANELIVGRWQVVNVARGDAISSVVDGTDPMIVFQADGDVTLDTGCNAIRGTYELVGSRLFVDDVSQTRRACEPAEVMDQEAALGRALESADRVQIVPGQLTVLDRDGRILLIADQGGDR